MKFLCWDDDNETRKDAKTLEANAADEAAELFAEDAHHDEPFDSIDVKVKGPVGKSVVIRVDVDWSPIFKANTPS